MSRMSPQEPSRGRSALRHLDLAATWRTDIETAKVDLDAGPAQAFVLAAHALAWRAAALTLPLAVIVAGWLVARRDAEAVILLFAAGLGALGPQVLASLLTLPVEWFATVQVWLRGSRDAQVRFGLVGLAYPYYGWRYAYRGRRRPWGALTREERMRSNAGRAAGADPAGSEVQAARR